MTKKQPPKAVTAKLGDKTYTLHMGVACLIQLEVALGVPMSELNSVMAKPSLSHVRDLVAALLIEHHPQGAAIGAALKSVFGDDNRPVKVDWEQQQRLANRLIDAVGVEAAGQLIERAMQASPIIGSAGDEVKVA